MSWSLFHGSNLLTVAWLNSYRKQHSTKLKRRNQTTAGDILNQLGLRDYLLSKGPNDPFLANAESVYDKVNDGEKIFASTKAEVGKRVCA